jgi:hypothetical protein
MLDEARAQAQERAHAIASEQHVVQALEQAHEEEQVQEQAQEEAQAEQHV